MTFVNEIGYNLNTTHKVSYNMTLHPDVVNCKNQHVVFHSALLLLFLKEVSNESQAGIDEKIISSFKLLTSVSLENK